MIKDCAFFNFFSFKKTSGCLVAVIHNVVQLFESDLYFEFESNTFSFLNKMITKFNVCVCPNNKYHLVGNIQMTV